MILADTSVWIDHFRRGNRVFAELLMDCQVSVHPFVLGELACGNLADRTAVLSDIAELPHAVSATDAEVMNLIERRTLWGKGIGWVDAHLLASALLSSCALWTLDNRLNRVAESIAIATFAG